MTPEQSILAEIKDIDNLIESTERLKKLYKGKKDAVMDLLLEGNLFRRKELVNELKEVRKGNNE